MVEDEPVVAKDEPPDDDVVLLSGGGEMNVTSADAFLRTRRARVVALVGGNDVGKTTLLASLYEMAGSDRLKDFAFAGCETLRGFEERCHLSRAASNRLEPDTQRTRRATGLRFLHLRLLKQERLLDLLFAERAGEDYVDMLDSPTAMDMPELSRADSIALLVDGADLSQPSRRQLQLTRIRRIWMMLQQNQVVPRRDLSIQIVLTKLDLLQKSNDKAAGLAAFERLFGEIRDHQANDKLSVTRHHIAARPEKSSNVERWTGLEELLRAWLPEGSPVAYSHPPIVVRARNPYEELVKRIVGGRNP